MKHPEFRIEKPCYTMASVAEDTAEITMYGEIHESKPTDWWGEPVEGQFILLDEFMEDLKQVESAKNINIRMNSVGGDAMVSITIHNRLRDLAAQGKKLTCIVDGVAMSGGSLIMCACDTVKVNPSSLVMIHKAWSFIWGGYNADELRSLAEHSDAYDRSQVSIYKRKTGLSETVISHMMSDTTYMTGSEAVEKGFADELIEDAEPLDIAASANGRSLFVRGRKMHLAPGMFVPDSIKTVETEESASGSIIEPETTGREGGNSMNLEDLRRDHPDLVAQIEADTRAAGSSEAAAAVTAERKRLQGIDEVASLFDEDLVTEARYGETACDAQELCFRAAQRAASQGRAFLASMQEDADASNTGSVEPAPGNPEETVAKTPAQEQEEANSKIKELLK